MQKNLLSFLCSISCVFGFSQIYTEPLKLKLDSVFASIHENDPGGYIYVQMGNQTLYSKEFGVSNMDSKQKFNDFTVVNIGGLSRTFIAYGILILQQEGKLNLEDSIIKYIPNFKNKDLGAKIKIRHLMTHTSGLKDLPMQKMDSVHFLSITDKDNFELVKYTNKPSFEPGSNFLFSEQAFSALVLILEKVSGMSWQDFIKERICVPAGMTFTKFSGKPGETVAAANAYRKINGTYKEYDLGEVPKMYTAVNGGMWSNVVDIRKYAYALQYCLFLKCENVKISTDLMNPSNWYSQQVIPHSQCWFINQVPGLEYMNISYHGSIGGYRTSLIVVPQTELSIVIASNNSAVYHDELIKILKSFGYIK